MAIILELLLGKQLIALITKLYPMWVWLIDRKAHINLMRFMRLLSVFLAQNAIMSILYGDSGIMGIENDDTNSDLSEQGGRFLTKGAFLLTPSHDLSLDKAANICDKLNFRGSFSLTKTATGILFKFSEPDDYQQVFRKGFHKVKMELT